MLKVPKNIVAGQTSVKIQGLDGFHLVKEINGIRNNIKIKGYCGSFQWGDVVKYTNKIIASVK